MKCAPKRMLPTASTGKELPGKRDQGYSHAGSIEPSPNSIELRAFLLRNAKGHSLSKSEAAREKYA